MTYDAVAVPSYQRALTCARDTVATLLNGGVPASKVHVFVGGDEGDVWRYAQTLPPGVRTHSAPVGQQNAHNAICLSFGEGERVVTCDDDIRQIDMLSADGKKLLPVADLDALFTEAFRFTENEDATLWGIAPARNAMFMRHKWNSGLWFARGGLFGQLIIRPAVELTARAKEDYERTLLHYEHAGRVVRLHNVASHHRPMRTYPGGMQVHGERVRDEWQAMDYLMERWPGLVHPKKQRGDFPEVALRQPKRVPRTYAP